MIVKGAVPDELAMYFFAANTPAYLFRNFAGHSLIRDVAAKYSEADITREIESILDLGADEREAAGCWIYVLAVALALKVPRSESLTRFFRDVRWFSDIVALGRSSNRAVTLVTNVSMDSIQPVVAASVPVKKFPNVTIVGA